MKLFENEYFPIYLGAIIVLLIVAFLVVFFLGKKDKKKIEQTQNVEAVTDNAFKEASPPVPVEAPVLQNTLVINQNVEQPVVSEAISTPMPAEVPVMQEPLTEVPVVPMTITEVPVIPVTEASVVSAPIVEQTPITNFAEPVMPAPVLDPAPSVVEEESYKSQPIEPVVSVEPPVIPEMAVIPEVTSEPVIEPNLENFENLASSIASELEQLEKQQQVAEPIQSVESSAPVIETPVMPEPVTNQQSTKVVNDVFSSVYAPKREEAIIDDTMAIELPKLKEEPLLSDNKDDSLKL